MYLERGDTADFERCFEFEEDGLINENFSGLCAEEPDLVFCQLDLFTGSAPSHWHVRTTWDVTGG
jgi:hypothetical protein